MAAASRLIAAEVVAILNQIPDEELPLTGWTAERTVLPILEREQLTDVKVFVYPDSLSGDAGLQDRQCEQVDYGISVCVGKAVKGPEDLDAIDELTDLTEAIQQELAKEANWYLDNTEDGFDPDQHIQAELTFPYEADPIFDQNKLRAGIFLSRSIFTYQVNFNRRA